MPLLDAVTVEEYGKLWVQKRTHRVASAKDERNNLKNHVYPHIGDMRLDEVRPRHIRDLILTLREREGEEPQDMAPRTIRHIYAVVRRMFKSAVVEELLQSSPVLVDTGVLPKNQDKNPEFRGQAIYARGEVETLISTELIPGRRRVRYALQSLAGVRLREALSLRWRHYESAEKPLGRITLVKTKTGVTRIVPVHPTLAAILAKWHASGWKQTYGSAPGPDDLLIPTQNMTVQSSSNAGKDRRRDLDQLGWRRRRGHDLRRTFISLAQADGARRDLLKVITHGAARDIIDVYTTYPWASLCAEVVKLRIPDADENAESDPGSDDSNEERKAEFVATAEAEAVDMPQAIAAAASCAASRTISAIADDEKPQRSLVIPARLELATYGLGNRCSILMSYGTVE